LILYLDTSALLKRYFKEPFSNDVAFKWSRAEAVVSSSVAYAETMATIYRKKKGVGPGQQNYSKCPGDL
jgi:predicted nucleic acid-binding protein